MSLISGSLKGSVLIGVLSRGGRVVDEEEEAVVAIGGEDRIAEGTTGGAAPAEGQPDSVRSEAEEVERSPRCKERSGETV